MLGGSIPVGFLVAMALGSHLVMELPSPKKGMLVFLQRYFPSLSFKIFLSAYLRIPYQIFYHGLCPAYQSLQLKCHR